MMNLPEELKNKLAECKSDVEVAKMLADNGIDVEEFQKSLPDEVLNGIGGGYNDILGVEVYCPFCGAKEEDDISFQIIASFTGLKSKYRCRKCDNYFYKDDTGHMMPILK